MPSANPAPVKPNPKAIPKGKGPLGIPVWGWFAAAAIGIIIGYTVLRKSSGATAGDSPADSSSFSPSTDSAGSNGGGVAIPPEVMQALGLSSGTQLDASVSEDGFTNGVQGDSPVPSPRVQSAIDAGLIGNRSVNVGQSQGLDPAIQTAINSQSSQVNAASPVATNPASSQTYTPHQLTSVL